MDQDREDELAQELCDRLHMSVVEFIHQHLDELDGEQRLAARQLREQLADVRRPPPHDFLGHLTGGSYDVPPRR